MLGGDDIYSLQTRRNQRLKKVLLLDEYSRTIDKCRFNKLQLIIRHLISISFAINWNEY